MTNVELLLRWIPAFAGMTMYFVMPDLISLPCEILFCFVFNRACPVLDTGASREKTGTAEAIAECGLRIGASTMNRQDLEKRTKEFALEIIRLLSNQPKTLNRRGQRGRGGRRGKHETG